MARKVRATPSSGQQTPQSDPQQQFPQQFPQYGEPARTEPQAHPEPPERVLARLRPHGRALALPSLALIAIAGAVGYFSGVLEQQWQVGTLYGLAAVAVVLLWVLPLLRWLAHRYVITTRRIVLRRGLVVRVRQELLHSRGYDVSVRRRPLQTVFRSGDVRINTGLEAPVVLKDVPNANLVLVALQDLMEASGNPMASHRPQYGSRPGAAPDETQAFGRR
jgi:membrane protein YdbS with pleckstrin-like domain